VATEQRGALLGFLFVGYFTLFFLAAASALELTNAFAWSFALTVAGVVGFLIYERIGNRIRMSSPFGCVVQLFTTGLSFCALFVCIALNSGVRLRVENLSGSPIEHLEIGYELGVIKLDRLAPSESSKANLGAIGEGADFLVTWGDENRADFNVYFSDGVLGYNLVRVVFLPTGDAVLYEGDYVYESTTSQGSEPF